MITFFKRAWPVLRFFRRSPVPRTNFRTLPDGTPRTLPSGEVRTLT